MVVIRRHRGTARRLLAAFLLGMLGTMASAQSTDTQEPPAPPEPQAPPPLTAPRIEALPSTPDPASDRVPDRRAPREARAEGSTAAGAAARVYVPNEPPPPIAERPSADRPDPKAVWTSGYWEWDPDAARFVWVAGSWRVPPAGMVWSPGRWVHDERGWYWVAGTWTRRAGRAAGAPNPAPPRVDRPPPRHPGRTPPPAPRPALLSRPGPQP